MLTCQGIQTHFMHHFLSLTSVVLSFSTLSIRKPLSGCFQYNSWTVWSGCKLLSVLQGENTAQYADVVERIGGRLGPQYSLDRCSYPQANVLYSDVKSYVQTCKAQPKNSRL